MGQTQVLFIVLSVVLVGMAVAVGIDQFGENALSSNRDAVASDCQRIVSQSMQWYRKPTSLGGGGKDFTANGGLTFAKIGADSTNENGGYSISVVDADNITIVGTGNETNSDGSTVQVTVQFTASSNTFGYSDNLN
jgi:hypothetical protein